MTCLSQVILCLWELEPLSLTKCPLGRLTTTTNHHLLIVSFYWLKSAPGEVALRNSSRKFRKESYLSLGTGFGSLVWYKESSERSHWLCVGRLKKILKSSLSSWVSVALRFWVAAPFSLNNKRALVYRIGGSSKCVWSDKKELKSQSAWTSSTEIPWCASRQTSSTCCFRYTHTLWFGSTVSLAEPSNTSFKHQKVCVSAFCLLYPRCCFPLWCLFMNTHIFSRRFISALSGNKYQAEKSRAPLF